MHPSLHIAGIGCGVFERRSVPGEMHGARRKGGGGETERASVAGGTWLVGGGSQDRAVVSRVTLNLCEPIR